MSVVRAYYVRSARAAESIVRSTLGHDRRRCIGTAVTAFLYGLEPGEPAVPAGAAAALVLVAVAAG